MSDKKFNIYERRKSFSFAFEGLKVFFVTQHNAWIHTFAALAAISAGFYFDLNSNEWCWITLAIALVFISEIFNTAFEFLSDVVSPQYHPQIKKVKDVSAAGVLVASIAALIIGSLIFVPRVWNLF
jgi:diacylglycerol kinase (ATP)